MGMTVDTTDFEKGMKKLVDEVEPTATAKGLFEAGNQLLRLAIGEPNFAPFHVNQGPKDKHQGGALRASATTQTPDGKMRSLKSPAEAAATSVGKGNSIRPGFNIEYAARWHELSAADDASINWTLSGAGRKYLESKMVTFKDGLMEIVAERLRRSLDKGGK